MSNLDKDLYVFFNKLYRNVSDYILIANMDKQVVYFNSELQKYLDLENSNDYFIEDIFKDKWIDKIYSEFANNKIDEYKFDSVEFTNYKVTIKGSASKLNVRGNDYVLMVFQDNLISQEKNNDIMVKSILNSIFDAAIIHHKKKVIYFNEPLLNLMEITVEQIYDLNIFDFIHPDFIETAKSRIKSIELNRNVLEPVYYKFITAKGNTLDVEVYGIPIEFEGKPAELSIIKNLSETKKLENIIKEKDLVFQSILDLTPSAIFIHQYDNFVLVNKSTEKLSGYSRDELLNMNILDVVHPDMVDLVAEIAIARQKGLDVPTRYNLKILNKSGEEIWLDYSATKIFWKGKESILGTAFDITEKIKVELMLKENIERFKKLFMENSMIQLVVDIENLKIEDANPAASNFYGYPIEKLKGMSILDVVCVNKEKLQKLIKNINSDSGKFGNIKHKLSNGEIKDVEVFPSLVMMNGKTYLHAMILDVTEKLKAEELNNLLKTSIEQSPVGIVITDSDANIIYVNPEYEKVLGYSTKELIGKKPSIFKSGLHDTEFYKNLWDTIINGKIWQGKITNQNKNKELLTEETRIAPVFNKTGKITHYIAVKLDVTEKLKLEEQYLQAQKMESVGRLAGGIAHDFNNMLSVILNYATLALNLLDESTLVYEYVNEIYATGEKSANLTSQLLAYARKQTISPEIIDVNKQISNLFKMIRRLIREDIMLKCDYKQKDLFIKIDINQFNQLIMNLCVNASDAIENEGLIEIITDKFVPDSKVDLNLKENEYVVISIKDNGKGIDDNTLVHIFEPFYTTKSANEGTGLGLSTVYGIVKQNSGHIDVNSEVGKGTEFKIYLPATYEVDIIEEENTIQDTNLNVSNKKILLVEDDISLLNATKIILEESGYNILIANSPFEAIDIVNKNEDKIDLLMTDIIMPKMNGFKLSEKIREIYPDIKIIFMSGYSEDVISNDSVLLDNIYFIQKPYTIDKLLNLINTALKD